MVHRRVWSNAEGAVARQSSLLSLSSDDRIYAEEMHIGQSGKKRGRISARPRQSLEMTRKYFPFGQPEHPRALANS
ncbi:hypothetical protein FGK63_16405 [Ruegeria sediminis]|uniref:Uncharacterized protein n=1 Tax=Ruegeria sediminis TaxID=2583820 RepID=A0ABY2WV16_9RHOB|nr:hypothetical protein [Ruegeria sediminis]TMV05624.1 hypothetical protein FGK63_16405 [Ruegeria sediminis]